jgi:hypothetical protein
MFGRNEWHSFSHDVVYVQFIGTAIYGPLDTYYIMLAREWVSFQPRSESSIRVPPRQVTYFSNFGPLPRHSTNNWRCTRCIINVLLKY